VDFALAIADKVSPARSPLATAAMTEAHAPALDRPLRGIACVVGGVTVFSIQDVVIKLLSGDYPVFEIVFVRSVVAVLPLLIFVLPGGLVRLRPQRPAVHLARALMMFASYGCYYLALAALSLPQTVSLFYSAPLFMTALSMPLLGERVGIRRWSAVIVGFAGVLVMLQPEGASASLAAALALGSAVTYALSALMTRRLGTTDSAEAMAFSATVIYIAASAAAGIVFGGGRFAATDNPSLAFLLRAWDLPAPSDLALMALCGFIAAAGFYLLGQAYRTAPAAVVAPFEYASLPWAVLWGYAVWGTVPRLRLWLGIALVVGSGLYLLRREALRNRNGIAAGRTRL
jgi:drug/metabolite transporter (DMT)-like permease